MATLDDENGPTNGQHHHFVTPLVKELPPRWTVGGPTGQRALVLASLIARPDRAA
jgi:hypothetical protein